MRIFWSFLLALVVIAAPARATTLMVTPDASVPVNEAAPGRFDFTVQTVAVIASAGQPVTLEGARVVILAGGQETMTREIAPERFVRDTARLASAPVAALAHAQFLDANGVSGRAGRPIVFAQSAALAPDTALAATGLYFATDFRPDAVRVEARVRDARGRVRMVSATTPVRAPSAITHRMPLAGVWLMHAVPAMQSHHRFNPPTEYAVDFFQLDRDGRVYGGDRLDARTAYAFGAPVLASADGVVVRVVDDVMQDRAAAFAGGEAEAMARMRADFGRAIAGNLIVIRHEHEGASEYSIYGHLRTGSARVREGARVAAGEVIAEVGDTGDTPTPHLHYQLNAGPDPFYSQSLPVRFANARSLAGGGDLGRMVSAPQP